MRNRIIKGKGVGIAILTLALAALLLFTACAPAPIAPAETTVEIGAVIPVTGAAASSMQLMMRGMEDYIRYFNEQEGIPGVRIGFIFADTMLQTAMLLSGYERLAERGVPVMQMEEATGLLSLKSRFERDEVVIIGGGQYEMVAYPPGWCYATTPTMAEQFVIMGEYFMQSWQEATPPRLAFMSIDSAVGREALGELTIWAQNRGFEVLPLEIVPFVVLDATTQLLRLKESEVDLVYFTGLPAAAGAILRDAERLALLDEMQFCGYFATLTEGLINMAGVGAEGYFYPRMYPWFDEIEVPGIKLMLDNQMKYHGELTREGEYMNGWVMAVPVCEAIRRAAENVGRENIDGRAVKEAMDSLKDFDVYGLASFTYKPGDHRGITKVAVYQVRDGKIVRVTDWQEVPSLVPGE